MIPGVNYWECLQVVLPPERPANTRSDWHSRRFYPPLDKPGSEGQTGGLLVVSSPLESLSGICRIVGAHKPHRHAKAVPHRLGHTIIIIENFDWWCAIVDWSCCCRGWRHVYTRAASNQRHTTPSRRYTSTVTTTQRDSCARISIMTAA